MTAGHVCNLQPGQYEKVLSCWQTKGVFGCLDLAEVWASQSLLL
jgi:hypothetical protein